MRAWICWRLSVGPHVALSVGCWLGRPAPLASGGLGVGLFVGGHMVCAATAEVRQ
jgi:hypothetical protein